MNVYQVFVLAILGLALSPVNARNTTKDIACGPGRYYNYLRNVCLPW
ncbi:uncharacterized protein LOC26534466 [Drosophila yakuba]|uniref:Uncharacterized protein n=1 Tax=Drosophila yakuba TaxID=7245 RepID=A0A0R1E1A4_DROYA|nr:uncharacterized protein LOC26534466 [Drosophila yakuba]KRK01955.1 uncharacterized protein Dyak_GE27285 [Drosophila yakuba]